MPPPALTHAAFASCQVRFRRLVCVACRAASFQRGARSRLRADTHGPQPGHRTPGRGACARPPPPAHVTFSSFTCNSRLLSGRGAAVRMRAYPLPFPYRKCIWPSPPLVRMTSERSATQVRVFVDGVASTPLLARASPANASLDELLVTIPPGTGAGGHSLVVVVGGLSSALVPFSYDPPALDAATL